MQIGSDFLVYFFIYSLRAIIALAWGGLLLSYSRRSHQNLPFGIIFVVVGLWYLYAGFVRIPMLEAVDVYSPLGYLMMVLVAPFTIFYAWFALGEKHTKSDYLLQFTPLPILLLLWIFVELSGEPPIPSCYSIEDMLGYSGQYPLHVWFYIVLMLVFLAQVFSYFSIALVKILRVWEVYRQHNIPVRPVRLLLFLDFLFLLYPLIGVVYLSYNNNLLFGLVYNFFISVCITLMSIFNLRLLLPLQTNVAFVSDPSEKLKASYADFSVEQEASSENGYELVEGIKQLFEVKEIYRLPQLSLDDVAQELNSNRSYVSACINKHFGCNFRQLLTKYRIDAVKELLVNSDMEVQTIVDSVGFNTRTSFYKAFKENVSDELSPLEWRRQAQVQLFAEPGTVLVSLKTVG